MKTIKICFCIATLSIVFLTGLAGYLLISNIGIKDSLVTGKTEQCYNSTNNSSKTTPTNNQPKNQPEDETKISASDANSYFNSDDYKGLLDSIVYNVTLAVNSVNNVLASGSIFLGIITIFIGLVGLFGYHHLKEELNKQIHENKEYFDKQSYNTKVYLDNQTENTKEYLNSQMNNTKEYLNFQTNLAKEDIDKQITAFSSILEKAEVLVKSADALKHSLVSQQLYIEMSNVSLFKSVYAITNRIPDEDIARNLLQRQSHIVEIINLYRPCIIPDDQSDISKKKQAALLYFRANGTKDDLQHLKYVAENDIDPEVRVKAQEVIIRIELREEQTDESHKKT